MTPNRSEEARVLGRTSIGGGRFPESRVSMVTVRVWRPRDEPGETIHRKVAQHDIHIPKG